MRDSFVSLLSRLFWPEEMRQLIETYRRQDCLNLRAVKNYADRTAQALYAMIALTVLICSGTSIILAPFGLLLVFSLRSTGRKLFAVYPVIYARGIKTELIVGDSKKMRGQRGSMIFIDYQLPDGEIAKFYYNGTHFDPALLPSKGQLAPVYYYPEGRYKVAPAIESFRQEYALSL